MSNIDKRDRLKDAPFTYKVAKDNKVFIFWQERQVMILKDKASERFLAKIEKADKLEAQLIMAKITGNFKHGNEKNNKKKSRNGIRLLR